MMMDDHIDSFDKDIVFVFDWDDTIFPNTVMTAHLTPDEVSLPLELKSQLKELEMVIVSFLNFTLKTGKTFIITNAEKGWVQFSAQKYLPNILPLLSKIEIISARSSYETFYPGSPSKWKLSAFHNVLNTLENAKHVIVFGDSLIEINAIHYATQTRSDIFTKSVKFVERPTLSQLIRQIELVISCFRNIVVYEGTLDLSLILDITSESRTLENDKNSIEYSSIMS